MRKKRYIGKEILEAIQDIKQGKGKRKTIENFEDVRRVRNELHLSQVVFSAVCNSSIKVIGHSLKAFLKRLSKNNASGCIFMVELFQGN